MEDMTVASAAGRRRHRLSPLWTATVTMATWPRQDRWSASALYGLDLARRVLAASAAERATQASQPEAEQSSPAPAPAPLPAAVPSNAFPEPPSTVAASEEIFAQRSPSPSPARAEAPEIDRSRSPTQQGDEAARRRIEMTKKFTQLKAEITEEPVEAEGRRPAGWDHMTSDQRRAAVVARASSRSLEGLDDKAETALFDRMDYNGNGGLSLAEIDKAIIELYPAYNHKPSLLRAYKAADRDGNGFVTRREFKKLLHFLVYFSNLWAKFEEIDGDGDGRLSPEEFSQAAALVGHRMSAEEATAAFVECDSDGGGLILFDEFCVWCAHRHVGGGFVAADERAVDRSAGHAESSQRKNGGGGGGGVRSGRTGSSRQPRAGRTGSSEAQVAITRAGRTRSSRQSPPAPSRQSPESARR